MTKSGPAKSTPVFVNGGESLTRLAGKGATLGVLNAYPSNFLQIIYYTPSDHAFYCFTSPDNPILLSDAI